MNHLMGLLFFSVAFMFTSCGNVKPEQPEIVVTKSDSNTVVIQRTVIVTNIVTNTFTRTNTISNTAKISDDESFSLSVGDEDSIRKLVTAKKDTNEGFSLSGDSEDVSIKPPSKNTATINTADLNRIMERDFSKPEIVMEDMAYTVYQKEINPANEELLLKLLVIGFSVGYEIATVDADLGVGFKLSTGSFMVYMVKAEVFRAYLSDEIDLKAFRAQIHSMKGE